MQAAIQAIIDHFTAERTRLLSQPPEQADAVSFFAEHTDLVDRTLGRLYDLGYAEAQRQAGEHYQAGKTELAIMATGGYGRGQLAPHSDIDIAFVPSQEDNPFIDALLRILFRGIVAVFVDHSDMQVGYAFRPLSDIAGMDHETKTSLLDARVVAGYAPLLPKLQKELHRQLDVAEYLTDRTRERRSVGRRHQTSVYAIEPNLKESAGGLRDLQSALWMVQVRFGLNDTAGVISRLRLRGIISQDDISSVFAARDFLHQVRVFLHLRAGQANDTVLSEHHGALGRRFGFVSGELTAGQKFMREYYRHAEQIHRFTMTVAKRLTTGSVRLNERFSLIGRRLVARAEHLFEQHPEAMIEAFALMARYGVDFDQKLDHQIDAHVRHIDDAVRCSSSAGRWFLQVLRLGGDAVPVLRQMIERRVLPAYLPEFGEAMHFVPPDTTHERTVGDHSLRVLQRISAIESRQPRDEPSPLWEAAQSIADREILMLAALLHDVGKIVPRGDHATVGAALAGDIGRRMGLDEDRVELLQLLVREHLILPHTARVRDIDDDRTIDIVCAAVGDVQKLKMLYVLAFADTEAVSSHSFTEVDLINMEGLYSRVLRALAATEVGENLAARAAVERQRIFQELSLTSLDDEALRRVLDALPPSYLLNTHRGAIATHARFLQDLQQQGLVVDVYNPPGRRFTELTVCAYDDPEPGMLSKIAAPLYAAGVDVNTAQVFTLAGEPSIVLDTLTLTHDGRQLATSACERVSADLQAVLRGDTRVRDLLASAGVATDLRFPGLRLHVSNDLSAHHTVVHCTMDDQRGLLYFTARALSALGLDIHTAKIATWAGRGEDAYYVTNPDGAKVPDAELPRIVAGLQERLAPTEPGTDTPSSEDAK